MSVNLSSSFRKTLSIPEYRALAAATDPASPIIHTETNRPGTLIKQLNDQLFNHIIEDGITFALFDDSQIGELTAFEISTDNPNIILQIYYYADNPNVFTYVNNLQMHELLSLGRGLSPGDVAPLPNGQSQDIPGRPSAKYPYLARFKYDPLPDFTAQFTTNLIFGAQPNVIVLKFEPTIPTAYKRIVGNIINADQVNSATIITLDIQRLIHEEFGPGEAPVLEATQKSQANVRRTVAVPVSPDYSSYLKKKQQQQDELTYEQE